MKLIALLPLLLVYCLTSAQPVPPNTKATVEPLQPKPAYPSQAAYVKNATIATLSVGFADYYRKNYAVPTGFKMNNQTGFAPVFGRLEYGVGSNVTVGAMFCYDVFYSNFYKIYLANGNEYKRYNTDRVRLLSGGLAAYYHFARLIPVKKLDVFAGLGFSLNNVHHSAMPQGDSTANITDHTVSPMLKLGARYYLSKKGSFFADAGYDRKALFSLGFSCRFSKN